MTSLISLEDHFVSEALLARPDLLEPFAFNLWSKAVTTQLSDVADVRVSEMDKGDIAVQVVSAIPVTAPPAVCISSNDQLAAAVKKSDSRLAGFAMLPMADPVEAISELRRCVNELGFLGAMIPNHANGTYYDGEEYHNFWAAIEQLEVPLYIHPTNAPLSHDPLYANMPPEVASMLSKGGWGWHADTALHFIRLYAGGIFDRFPRLRVVLGHAGEMLPYMLKRIDGRLSKVIQLRRGLLEVWSTNIWITISGMWDLAPFACLQRAVAANRIMYSVDYPYESNVTGRTFMNELRDSGMVTPEQWQQVAWRNAASLLRLSRDGMPLSLS